MANFLGCFTIIPSAIKCIAIFYDIATVIATCLDLTHDLWNTHLGPRPIAPSAASALCRHGKGKDIVV
jgi:hypothetical protein